MLYSWRFRLLEKHGPVAVLLIGVNGTSWISKVEKKLERDEADGTHGQTVPTKMRKPAASDPIEKP